MNRKEVPISRNIDRVYDHIKIEQKWQAYWESQKIFYAEDPQKDTRKKFFALIEFPFPSGDGLHVGHIRSNTAMDVIARKRRMEGYNVLYPIGWDAFGLPTENYAIKTGLQPSVVTEQNTDTFRRQLKSLGFSFDWSREINTSNPEYFKWTQWILLQLLKAGLAYKKKMSINWCPKDLIGLANEEVVDGMCERCGTPVEKRDKEQWMLAITKYADRLDADLDETDFLEKIKIQQRNWIGKSEGALIDFPLVTKTAKRLRFVILHGYKESPEDGCLPWLKKTLESRGYEVQIPAMPHPDMPTEDEQVAYVLDKCTFDENTVIIGHSLGCVVAKKVVEKLPTNISRLVLVASAVSPLFGTSKPRSFHDTFTWNFSYDLIKKKCISGITVLADTKEVDRNPYLKYLADKLVATYIETSSVEKHFCGKEEPAVLRTAIPNIQVFTTRPDTLFGVTYLVVSPDHTWVHEILPNLENQTEVETYLSTVKKKSDIDRASPQKEKTGMKLEGVVAINPASGEEITVWIADYVLSDYGTGAVMAVPAHDERDKQFALKYDLPVRDVLDADTGILSNSGNFSGKKSEDIMKEIVGYVGGTWVSKYKLRDWVFSRQRYWGEPIPVVHCDKCGIVPLPEEDLPLKLPVVKNYKPTETGESPLAAISDWVNTTCPKCVERNQKPHYFIFDFDGVLGDTNNERIEVKLFDGFIQEIKKIKNAICAVVSSGSEIYVKPLLEKAGITFTHILSFEDHRSKEEKIERICKDWNVSVRDIFYFTDTKADVYELENKLDKEKIVGCAWGFCGIEKLRSVLPEKQILKGFNDIHTFFNTECQARRETDTMPNWAGSSWYYLRYTDPRNTTSLADSNKLAYWTPVDWYNGGMEHTTLHLLYSRFWHKFLYDIKVVPTKEPYQKRTSHGLILASGGEKMSKSKGNVVNPDGIVNTVGADSLRLYEMFMGPFDQHIAWDENGIVGTRRFIEKVWRLFDKLGEVASSEALINKTIKKVSEDIEQMRFNTAISTLMIAVNELEKQPYVSQVDYSVILQLLSPFAPHVTEELWSEMGNKTSIIHSSWPKFDPAKVVEQSSKMVIQVNGKVRAELELDHELGEDEIRNMAINKDEIKKWIENKEIKNVVFIKGKLINIVV